MPARVVFAGTPTFALESLRALVEAGVLPVAVLTQPDRRAGRGRTMQASPVKRFALQHGIPVWQPPSLHDGDVVAKLDDLRPDAMVVAAYGLIFPPRVLEIPQVACVNVHASLLPRWRGAAPIQAALLAGDDATGISLMRMEAGLDSGPVYIRESLTIRGTETAGELNERLAALGGRMLAKHLEAILDLRIEPQPQDETLATYAKKIGKTDAYLDWQRPAVQLERAVRAFNPAPGASFELAGERVKCWSARAVDGSSAAPGTILDTVDSRIESRRDSIDVACGDGVLRLFELQRPGRRKVSAAEFRNQRSLTGLRLGT